jgi:lantibiotic modifying enzyme
VVLFLTFASRLPEGGQTVPLHSGPQMSPHRSVTRAWQPLLHGRLRAEALAAVRDIAEALRDPPDWGDGTFDPATRATLRLLLNTGIPGHALLFGYLAQARAKDGARGTALGLLEAAACALPHARLDPWLLKGFTGVAWLNHHLKERSTDRAGDANDAIDAALLRLLRRDPWTRGFDLLYGLVGLGVYALERLPRRNARTMLGLVVRHLGRLAERRPEGLAWLTRPDGIAFTPKGSYSLGMAHGVPGVIALLARALHAGVAVRESRALLLGAVPWLVAQRLAPDRDSVFPPWVYPGRDAGSSRAAWCYGDAGVALALFAAGRAVRRPAWMAEAVELGLRTGRRSPESAGIRDATLCHGAVGLAHLLNRLYQATGDERLAEVAQHWYAEALRYRCPGRGIAGFERYGSLHATISEPGPDGTPPSSSDPGLLTGVTGIALALLAAATPVEPAWDRLLLVDLPLRAVLLLEAPRAIFQGKSCLC